jgi:hypothetical protein
LTIPAAETMSIGLLACALLSWFLHRYLDNFILTGLNPAHLPGLSHLDNFIVTKKSCPLTGTLQKLMPTLTQTATPHTTGPLGVINSSVINSYHDHVSIPLAPTGSRLYLDNLIDKSLSANHPTLRKL